MDRIEEIQEVWEQYKHLDHLLSDPEWLDDQSPQSKCLFDLWQAIRKAME